MNRWSGKLGGSFLYFYDDDEQDNKINRIRINQDATPPLPGGQSTAPELASKHLSARVCFLK